MVSGGVEVVGRSRHYPIIAPALIMVGCLRIRNVVRIPRNNHVEVISAFLTIMIMSLTFSITDGIARGFIPRAPKGNSGRDS